MDNDPRYMRYALSLARRVAGMTAPNPAVGCVLVKDKKIIGAAHTAAGGRPHAETQAIAQAGERCKGADAYVTLEPCAHEGQTPSCAQTLIDAGVCRAVIACRDPDPRTSGKGIAMLRSAGIEVAQDICAEAEQQINIGFFLRIQKDMPTVSLKIATSLDAMIANASGHSQWITGEQARMRGHLLRAHHDAIVTGIGTVLADDPSLTCRLPGMEHHSPIRVVMDTRLRIPLSSMLVQTAGQHPTWVITTQQAISDTPEHAETLSSRGIHFLIQGNPALSVTHAMRQLADEGLNNILIEAGTGLTSTAIAANIIDRLYWFRAPFMIGHGGKPAFDHEVTGGLDAIQRWKNCAIEKHGVDTLHIYTKHIGDTA